MGGKSVDVIWRQWDVYKDEENVQLLKDAYLAIGSFCTVFLLLWYALIQILCMCCWLSAALHVVMFDSWLLKCVWVLLSYIVSTCSLHEV